MSRLLNEIWHAFLQWLARYVVLYLPPPRPQPVTVTLVREENRMLVYKVNVPAVTADDVVSYEITEIVDGGTPTIIPVKVGDPAPEIKVADGSAVVLTVVEIDDAGNKSDPSPALAFTAHDTIPPPAPGAPTVELLREEP